MELTTLLGTNKQKQVKKQMSSGIINCFNSSEEKRVSQDVAIDSNYGTLYHMAWAGWWTFKWKPSRLKIAFHPQPHILSLRKNVPEQGRRVFRPEVYQEVRLPDCVGCGLCVMKRNLDLCVNRWKWIGTWLTSHLPWWWLLLFQSELYGMSLMLYRSERGK